MVVADTMEGNGNVGLREALNKSPYLGYGIVVVVLLLIAGNVLWQFGGSRIVNKGWFTIDDGATYFADDINKIPPFEKDGKTAYGCRVFSCDGGSTTFVAYLVRYTPGAKAKFEALGSPPPGDGGLAVEQYGAQHEAVEQATREVKRPKTGDEGWVLERSAPEGPAITTVKCPSGSGQLESVLP